MPSVPSPMMVIQDNERSQIARHDEMSFRSVLTFSLSFLSLLLFPSLLPFLRLLPFPPCQRYILCAENFNVWMREI